MNRQGNYVPPERCPSDPPSFHDVMMRRIDGIQWRMGKVRDRNMRGRSESSMVGLMYQMAGIAGALEYLGCIGLERKANEALQ